MKRLFPLLTTLLLLVGMTACTSGDDTAATTTTAGPTTTTTQSIQDLYDYNGLTGTYDLKKGSANRPIGFMVPNDSQTIGYQKGIDKADFYMECETEGSIPRLLAVFASMDRVPDTFGPLRSARSPFVATARALDIIYVHVGGSTKADAVLKTGVVDRLNANAIGQPTFWRDSELRSKVDYVHSLVTSREQITKRVEKAKFSTTKRKELPFTFGEKQGTTAANKVQLNTTPSQRATFIYDSETGLYGKNIGKMESCKPHKSLEGKQIRVSNVLVMYAEKYVEDTYGNNYPRYNFKEGTFSGYLISGGTAREIKFTRSADSFTVMETDGSPAQFAQGKIYMVLADEKLSSKIIFA